MAGLAAAHALRRAGVDRVVVLEQAAVAGGRMLSERLVPDGPWGNYGSQMITAERVNVVRLARSVGCNLLPVKWAHVLERARLTFQGMRVDQGEQQVLRDTIARLESEQARPRDPALPEIDDRCFADWLGEVPATVREFWEDWSQGLANASISEISLYAALCLWGEQRVSPWSSTAVAHHDLGDCVVGGGTGELGRLLGEALGEGLVTSAEVLECAPGEGGYRIRLGCAGGEHDSRQVREVLAGAVICALPAPVAVQVNRWLPPGKAEALSAVRYGRFLVTPIWVAPASERHRWPHAESYREGQTYALPAFPLRTPDDPELHGACYQSWLNDRDAGAVWQDGDESIRCGVRAAFLRRFPEYEERIVHIGIKRWPHGLPKLSPGRLKGSAQLVAAVEGMHFCGDYSGIANLEEASRSGERAAGEVTGAVRAAVSP